MGSQSIAEGGKAKEEALQACAKQHREWPVGCSMQDWIGPLQPPLDLPCRHWPPPPPLSYPPAPTRGTWPVSSVPTLVTPGLLISWM